MATADAVRVIEGDALEVLPTLEGEEIAAVVTDPPYGIVNKFGVNDGTRGKRRLQFDWDDDSTTDVVARAIALSVGKISRPGAAFVFMGFDQVGCLTVAMRSADLVVKPAAWVKTCPPPAGAGNWWPSAFEIAAYGYHPGAWFGDDNPSRSNVFVSDSMRFGQPGKVDHPTQKPLRLMTRIVRAICPPGGVVLDPFAGSETTGVAALKTGRRAILIEKDPRYIPIIRRRLADAATPLLDGLDRAGIEDNPSLAVPRPRAPLPGQLAMFD